MFKALKWEDWMGVVLGGWMLASPWILGYTDVPAAVMNAFVLGTILIVEESLDLVEHEPLEEWIDMLTGGWLVISPVALGFTASIAAANAVLVGLATMLFATFAMLDIDATFAKWWHEPSTRHARIHSRTR